MSMSAYLGVVRGLRTRFTRRLWVAAFVALSIAACGGSGGGAGAPGSAGNAGGGGSNNGGTGGSGGDSGGFTTPPTSVLALSMAGIKTLRLSWTDTAEENGYRLLVESDATASPVELARLPANTTQHELQVFLPDQLNARYTLQACRSTGCVDAASATVESALLDAGIGYFKGDRVANPPPDHVDEMGRSVALSADGNTLAVGTPYDDHTVDGSGAVYVFIRGAAGWVQQALLQAPNPAVLAEFGAALGLSSDGQRLVVGAPNHAGARGAFHVYERSNGAWTHVWLQEDPYPVVPPDAPVAPWFAWSVALSGDGNTVVAGRKRDDATAVVFARDNAAWVVQFAVPASAANDATALALSSDGNTLVVGRSGFLQHVPGPGVVDVYTRANQVWQSPPVQLAAFNPDPDDRFGWSVAISADAQTIAIGSPQEDGDTTGVNGPTGDNNLANSGAVYVFARDGSGWAHQAYLKSANGLDADRFGHAVSLSANGRALVATASNEDGSVRGLGRVRNLIWANAAGAAHLFRRDAGPWRHTAYIKASNTDAFDRFGHSVALSGDGLTLAVSAHKESGASTGIGGDQENNDALASGAVYLY